MRGFTWTVTAVMVGALAIAGAWETASGEYKILRKQKNATLYLDEDSAGMVDLSQLKTSFSSSSEWVRPAPKISI